MITVCFTGHRPNKLGGYDWNTPRNNRIMGRVCSAVGSVIEHNISHEKDFHFICGGALGIDQMAFEIVSELRLRILYLENSTCSITTEIAVPFEQQYIMWRGEDVDRWRRQLGSADKVTYVDTLDAYKIKGYKVGDYKPAKMQKRNEYMVDQSDIIIAVWNGTPGGTANCVHYAQSKGKRLLMLGTK